MKRYMFAENLECHIYGVKKMSNHSDNNDKHCRQKSFITVIRRLLTISKNKIVKLSTN